MTLSCPFKTSFSLCSSCSLLVNSKTFCCKLCRCPLFLRLSLAAFCLLYSLLAAALACSLVIPGFLASCPSTVVMSYPPSASSSSSLAPSFTPATVEEEATAVALADFFLFLLPLLLPRLLASPVLPPLPGDKDDVAVVPATDDAGAADFLDVGGRGGIVDAGDPLAFLRLLLLLPLRVDPAPPPTPPEDDLLFLLLPPLLLLFALAAAADVLDEEAAAAGAAAAVRVEGSPDVQHTDDDVSLILFLLDDVSPTPPPASILAAATTAASPSKNACRFWWWCRWR